MREEIILQFDAVNSSNVTTQATSSPDFSVGERGEVQELNGGISFREWMRVYKLKGEAGKSAVIGERFDPNEGSLGDGSEIPFYDPLTRHFDIIGDEYNLSDKD